MAQVTIHAPTFMLDNQHFLKTKSEWLQNLLLPFTMLKPSLTTTVMVRCTWHLMVTLQSFLLILMIWSVGWCSLICVVIFFCLRLLFHVQMSACEKGNAALYAVHGMEYRCGTLNSLVGKCICMINGSALASLLLNIIALFIVKCMIFSLILVVYYFDSNSPQCNVTDMAHTVSPCALIRFLMHEFICVVLQAQFISDICDI